MPIFAGVDDRLVLVREAQRETQGRLVVEPEAPAHEQPDGAPGVSTRRLYREVLRERYGELPEYLLRRDDPSLLTKAISLEAGPLKRSCLFLSPRSPPVFLDLPPFL